MTAAGQVSPADEQARLEECATEPIHIPGAIQPHGVLLALDPATGLVVQVSANSQQLLGRAPDELLGRPLGALLRSAPDGYLEQALADGPGDAVKPIPVQVDGAPFDAVVHRSPDGLDVVELEPPGPREPDRLLPAVHTSMQRLSQVGTVEELRAEAVRAVRRLTGFDRVMAYHFHPDGHGEVVAEDRVPEMEPYLGLHYPASDIPAQAREMYVLRGSRIIVSTSYVPAALVPPSNPLTGGPTDLRLAELRSVSPHHLTFMRNMGQGASMSLSLVHDGALVGMISCGHRTARHVPYELRRGCEMLAQQVALQLRALSETRWLRHRLALQGTRNRLVEQMADSTDMAGAAVQGAVTVLDVLHADGAVVHLDGRVASSGEVPPPHELDAVVQALRRQEHTPLLVTDALAHDRPDLAELAPSVAGCVVVVLGEHDHLTWFRRPIAQTVEWLGDQSPGNRDTPLSPRNSFSRWRQTVTDRASAWDEAEVREAIDLGHVVAQHLAQLRAARAAARAGLTARVTTELAEAIDVETAVAGLARLVAPQLADWSIVTLVDEVPHAEGPRLRDVGWWHADESSRPAVEQYARLRLDAMHGRSPLLQALQTARPSTQNGDGAARLQASLRPGEAYELLGGLAPEAFVVVPVRASNRTLGLLTLYNGSARGPISPEDLATAEEVAGRAGLALENARLYRRQLEIAEGLQRSLLTEPPQSERAEIAVRFAPAAEAARVGGDWYDAFTMPDGSTVLVIGDVAGHDTTAAAAMGQLRSLLRGIAVDTGVGPAELLQRVDRAMRILETDTIATAVVVRVEPFVDEHGNGAAVLRWSNAGHPPPMLVTGDGEVVVTGAAAQLLLGVAADIERDESSTVLGPGGTLLLYTDGLVERRGQDLGAGIAGLQQALGRVAHLGLDEVCDRLLSDMLPEHPDDDVAVLALRLHP